MTYRTIKGSFQNKIKNLIFKASRRQQKNKNNLNKFSQGMDIGFLYGLIEARDLHYELSKKKKEAKK